MRIRAALVALWRWPLVRRPVALRIGALASRADTASSQRALARPAQGGDVGCHQASTANRVAIRTFISRATLAEPGGNAQTGAGEMRACGFCGGSHPSADMSTPDVRHTARARDKGLFPQPGSFESGRPVLVLKDVDDLVVPHLELQMEANIDLDPAGLTPGDYVDRDNDAVAFLDQLLQMDSVLIPGVE